MSITKDVAVRLHLNGADTVKASLTSVSEQADKLKTKTATLTINANDDNFMVDAAKVLAEAKKLGATKVKIAVDADTAHAGAAMKLINAEADKLGLKKVNIKVNVDDSEVKNAGKLGAAGGLVSGLSGVGDLFGAVDSEASGAAKGIALFNVATGILEPELAGAAVAAGGLAAGFLSAGAGVAIFGKVATAVWGQVQANITAYATAQQGIANGDTGKKQVADLLAMKTALVGLTGPQQQLVMGAGNASVAWHNFLTSSTAGVNSVLLPALGLVPKALALITPFLAPVEHALAGVVSGIGKGLDSSGLKSFIGMLASNAGPAITKIAGLAKNLGVGLGGIFKAFMPESQNMLGGLDKLTAKFASWGSSLSGGSGFKDLMNMFKQDTPLATSALKNLIGILKTVGGQMTGMDTFGNSKMFLQMAVAVSGLVNSLLKAHPELVWLVLYLKLGSDSVGKLKTAFAGLSAGVTGIKKVSGAVGDLKTGLKDSEAAAADGASGWTTFGGRISGIGTSLKGAVTAVKEWSIWSKIAGAATKVWTGIQIAFDAVMDANPIVLIALAVIALIAVIVLLVVKFKPVRDFFKQAWADIVSWTVDAWHGITKAFDAIVKAVTSAVSTVIDWVKAHWVLIASILTGPIGAVVIFIVTHWQQITAGAKKMFDDVVSFFKALPGKILSLLGNMGTLLWNAGRAIISGLLGGIKAAFEDVKSFVSGIGSWISSHKGPISYDATLLVPHGRVIMGGLVHGLEDGMPGLNAQLSKTTQVIAGSGLVSGGSSAQPALNVQIGNGSNDDLTTALVKALRENIRVTTGGNVQKWATGR